MAATPPTQPPSQSQYQPTPTGPTAARKTSPWVWVAVGCGGLLVIVLLAVTVGGYLLARKAKDFVAEAEKNPAMAAVRLAVSMNPELEIVEADEDDGIITVRNKRTGEEFTVDMAEAEKGKIRFRNEKGEEISFSTKSEDGKREFKVESDEGDFSFGAGDQSALPDWVPRYPGTELTGTMTSRSDRGVEGGFSFTTPDSVRDVLAYFEKQLKALGMEVSTNTFEQDDVTQGGVVGGESTDRDRTCTVTATRDDEATTVAVTYKEGRE